MTSDLLINGFLNGANIALFAAAFYIVYCIARTFHVALAGVYALTPFIFGELRQGGFSLVSCFIVSVATGATISSLCEIVNHRQLRYRGALPEAHLLSSLGIYVVIVQLILMMWGPDVRLLRTGLDPTYLMFGLNLRRSQLLSVGAAVIFLLPLFCILRWTRWGIALRALRDNPTELALLGFNESSIRAGLFALAGILASVSALTSSLEGGFQAHYGFPSLLLAVVATLSIRTDGIGAAVLSALGLGVVRTLCVLFLGSRWQDTVAYALFAVALVFHGRPQFRHGAQERIW